MISANVKYLNVIDTETTGLNVSKDGICAFASVMLTHLPIVRPFSKSSFLFDPGCPISPEASVVNGFIRKYDEAYPSDSNLCGLPTFADMFDRVFNERADDSILICHNAVFDIGMIMSNMGKDKSSFIASFPRVICTKQTFAVMQGKPVTFDYVPGTSLDKLCDYLSVDRSSHKGGHNALTDAELTAECVRCIFSNYPECIQYIETKDIALYHNL